MNARLNFSLTISGWKSALWKNAGRLVQGLRDGNGRTLPSHTAAQRAGDVVWRYSSPMEDLGTRWVPHRVVRRTPGAVQVEAEPFITTNRTRLAHGGRHAGTYWLDRDELRRLGLARARTRRTVFFERPQASNRAVSTAESLLRLGLWFPYDERQLMRAYRRRARRAHPDAGGSSERFVQLQRDYQRAHAALGESWGDSASDG